MAAAVPYNVGERFTSYNEPNNFESLDEAKRTFEEFVEYPPTLEEALKTARIPDCDVVLADSKRKGLAARKALGIDPTFLTDDEAGAIACYTIELGGDESPYQIINTVISSSRNAKKLNVSNKLVYLLLSGLRKLPRYKPLPGEKLYRSINVKVPTTENKANGHQYYADGRTVKWWGFTSTSKDPSVSNNFLKGSTEATTFIIGGKGLWGYDIQSFSKYPDEEEVLLEPESSVEIKYVAQQNPSLLEIHVDLKPPENLVLVDIIRPLKMSKGEIPEGLKVENIIYKGFELSWDPVSGKDNLYQVSMVNVTFLNNLFGSLWNTVYEGEKPFFDINGLDVGAKYKFWVRCKSDGVWSGWSKEVIREVEPLNVRMAINTLKKYSNDVTVCRDVLKETTALTEISSTSSKDDKIRLLIYH